MQITKQTKTIIFTALLTLSIFSIIILIFYNLHISTNRSSTAFPVQQPAAQVQAVEAAAPIVQEETTIQQPANIERMVIFVVLILVGLSSIGFVMYIVFKAIKKKHDARCAGENPGESLQNIISSVEDDPREVTTVVEVSEPPAPVQGLTISEVEASEAIKALSEASDTIKDLRFEVERLKEKSNQQLDCIENLRKNQVNTDFVAETCTSFIACVINAFNYLEQNELVYKPQRRKDKQGFAYVSSSDFYENITKLVPEVKKKDVLEALLSVGIITGTPKEYETVYQGKRVLKINETHFALLTKGLTDCAEA